MRSPGAWPTTDSMVGMAGSYRAPGQNSNGSAARATDEARKPIASAAIGM